MRKRNLVRKSCCGNDVFDVCTVAANTGAVFVHSLRMTWRLSSRKLMSDMNIRVVNTRNARNPRQPFSQTGN